MFKYKYLLTIPLCLFLFTQAIASTFSMQKLAFINWGNGANQAALIRAAPLNLGPPSIEQFGDSLYILDATHQRILVVNTSSNQQINAISYNAPDATDFCVTNSGKFSLLFADAKQVITYNSQGKYVKTQSINKDITPLSIYCNRTWVIETFEGGFYSSKGKIVKKRPFGKYRVAVELTNFSQGKIQISHNQRNYRFYVKAQQGSELVFLDVIGADSAGHVFVTIEESSGEQLSRYLRKYSKTGKLLASIKLPYSVYTYTLKDLAVSASGVVYQMVQHKDALKLVQWDTTRSRSRTSSRTSSRLSPRDLFSYTEDNPNDFGSSEAPSATRSKGKKYNPHRSRSSMMKTAKEYANYSFEVDDINITPPRQHLGGKMVTTPIRKPGYYKGIPYKWGGFDSLDSFQEGLESGKKAGDICASKCSGVYRGSRKVVGVDCSGFVSRVWGLKNHTSTRSLPKLSNEINFSQLRQGDILNRQRRHVMLFDHRDNRGQFHVYEAVTSKGKVLKRSHSYRSVKKYQPRRYQNISDNHASLVISGIQNFTGGQSQYYSAILHYNNERRDVTDEVIWTETSFYAKFRQAQLKTKSVAKDQYFFVKAHYYAENGETVKAKLRITIKASQSSIPLYFGKIYSRKDSNKGFNLTNKSILNSGDIYKFVFSPTKKTYVYIFQVDASGNVQKLFPDGENGNPTSSGKTYFAPKTDWFLLDNTRGREQFYLIATEQPDQALERQSQLVKIARDENNYQQLQQAQKKLEKMLEYLVKYQKIGMGSTASRQVQGKFSWKENKIWLSTARTRFKIKGGIVWSFKHR